MLCYNVFMVKLCQTAILFCLVFLRMISAQAIEFQFPVACRLMSDCWITNHVDLDDREGMVSDYMCGVKATDNNLSTHISLASRSAVTQNIPVLAAANGTVTEAGDIGGFCGTRILIKHKDGWETSYCHLNSETLQIRAGKPVKQGQVIGSIGLSGQTDWPRLSFATIRNGMVFDPFSGRTTLEGCAAESKPLWVGDINPPYEPAAVISAGFTVGYVASDDILNGAAQIATAIRADTRQMTLWAMMMNLRTDDHVTMAITDPAGNIIKSYETDVKNDAIYFPINLSALRANILWDAGRYEGKITITRRVNGNKITSGRLLSVDLIAPY